MVAQRAMIELRRLYRYFDRTCAVNDISFEVGPGEVFGYIGPNGAGKTTSMRILATLDTPSAGDAFVDGFSVVNDPDRVRRRLGFMPDDFGTYSNVNCIEYLDFFARAYGLIGRERHRALQRVIGFTGLDVMIEKPINGLSKGMKQRLCLGRALIHNPSVLILDEPAAGLDPRARIELRDIIGLLAAEGKSILVSSHILTELGEMCDRVAIIEQGTLLAVGTVDEILHKMKLSPNGAPEMAMTTMNVEVLESPESLLQWIEAKTEIEEPRMIQNVIRFQFPKSRELQAELLSFMIREGFHVSSFSEEETTLEEVFLHVTQGRVQ